MSTPLVSHSGAWQALQAHRDELSNVHLKQLLQDESRPQQMAAEFDGIFLDYSRQRVTPKTMNLLFDLAELSNMSGQLSSLRSGAPINSTENRAVLHVALRANKQEQYVVDGVNVVEQVHQVLSSIESFSNKIRSGELRGHTGKPLKNVLAIGIGGSYLGANFVHEALHSDSAASRASSGRALRFLANVDPVAFSRAIEQWNPEETLAVIISKTFTTRETMLNANTVRQWFVNHLGASSISKHMVAVSTSIDLCVKFGVDASHIFPIWDWVGGRYSVTSAVGVLPLALHYGWDIVQKFLNGARAIDHHFFTAAPRENLPLLLGLLGVWNNNFLGYHSRALACYSEAMMKLAPHIQQVDMESNGKSVTIDGQAVDYQTGEVNFGEPGTNSQHSFFQLFHQGQVVPVDFIGFIHSQQPIKLKGEEVANHDELMANFFAQPDALACGKSAAELAAEKVPAALIPHKTMPGNRPSNVLLLPQLTAYEIGQLLSLYEHRTVVQGFIWRINSFDQFGVELGKKLADQVRSQFVQSRANPQASIQSAFIPSTRALLQRYISQSQQDGAEAEKVTAKL